MAGAYVQSNNNAVDSTATTITTTLTGVTTGNTITVFACHEVQGGFDVSSVADTNNNSAAYGARQATAVLTNPNNERLSIYKCENVTGNAGTVTYTVTFSGSVQFRRIWVVESTGHKTSPAIDGVIANNSEAPGTGTDAVTTGNTTNATQPGFAIAFGYDDDAANAPTQGTGWTDRGTGLGGNARLTTRAVTTTGNIAGVFTSVASHGGDKYLVGLVVYDDPAVAITSMDWGSPSPPRGSKPVNNRALNEDTYTSRAPVILNATGWGPNSDVPSKWQLPRMVGVESAAAASQTAPADLKYVELAPAATTPRAERRQPLESFVHATLIAATLTTYGWQQPEIPQISRTRPWAGTSTGAEQLKRLESPYVDWAPGATRGPSTQSKRAPTDADVGTRIATVGAFVDWAPSRGPAQSNPRLLFVDVASTDWVGYTGFDFASPTSRGRVHKPPLPLESFLGQTLGFAAPASAMLAWAQEPARGRWTVSRPTNEPVVGSPLGFAPNPAFTGWAGDPARGKWAASRSQLEAFAGTSLAPGSFVQWTADAVRQAVGRPVRVADDTLLGQLGLADPLANDEPQRARQSRASPSADPFVGTPLGFAPSPAFAAWTVDSPIRPWRQAARAPEQHVLGSLQSTFASWTDALVRQGPASPRRFDEAPLAAVAPPPTSFVEWSLEPPRAWKFKLARPDAPPVTSTVTLPPSTTFVEWWIAAPRGTSVTSSRAEPPSYLGTFIVPPTLSGLTWAEKPAQGAWASAWASARALPEQILGPLPAGAFPWHSEPARGASAPSRSFPETFLGAALSSGFSDWSPAPPRSPTRGRPAIVGGNVTGPWLGLGPLDSWATDLRRPPLTSARAGSVEPLGIRIAPPSGWFDLTSAPPWHRATEPLRPETAAPIDETVLVALPSLGWATFELPPHSPPGSYTHAPPLHPEVATFFGVTDFVIPDPANVIVDHRPTVTITLRHGLTVTIRLTHRRIS